MLYRPGDKIVHPLHGAGIVEDIISERVSGTTRSYYVFITPNDRVKVMIPVDAAERIGVRDVMSSSDAMQVMEQFHLAEPLGYDNWNRRYRNNMLKLRSGDSSEICRVLKTLMLRQTSKGLSSGEQRIMTAAKQILISELSFATGMSVQQIEQKLIDSIA